MSSPLSPDVAEVLQKRHDWLPYLRDVSLTKPELCSVLDVSRSTVDRGITDLETVELVERTADGYCLTAFGCLLLQLRSSYMSALDVICRAQAIHTPLPTGEHGEQVVFDRGDVVLPESHLPEKPTRRILELLTESRSVRGFTPVMHDQYVRTSYEQVVGGDLNFEFLITPQILDGIISMYADWVVAALDLQRFTILETTDLPPFGLAIFERDDGSRTVVLGVYADNGLSGIVENDTTRAIGWAQQLYDDYKQSTSPIDPETIRQLDDQVES